MGKTQTVKMLYGRAGMALTVPAGAAVLEGKPVEPLADPAGAVKKALEAPISGKPLARIVAAKRPRAVAITISDITRPVPNREFLPAMLEVLKRRRRARSADRRHHRHGDAPAQHAPGARAPAGGGAARSASRSSTTRPRTLPRW